MIKYYVVLLMFFGVPLSADTAYQRVLIPLTIGTPVPGAHGSLWESTLTAFNTRDHAVEIGSHFRPCQGISLCPPFTELESGTATRLWLSQVDGHQGAVLFVERDHAGAVFFHHRVHDLSRQLHTRGTEIPVVREPDFFDDRFVLIDIPAAAGFRTTLRLYDLGVPENASAVVRIYGSNPLTDRPEQLLQERVVTLRPPPPGKTTTMPAYFEWSGPAEIAGEAGFEHATIEVIPLIEGMKFWGFVSITHNETQHVTMVTPR